MLVRKFHNKQTKFTNETEKLQEIATEVINSTPDKNPAVQGDPEKFVEVVKSMIGGQQSDREVVRFRNLMSSSVRFHCQARDHYADSEDAHSLHTLRCALPRAGGGPTGTHSSSPGTRA